MNDKDFYKSVGRTSKALDKYSSQRARRAQPTDTIMWGRVTVALIALVIFIGFLAWFKILAILAIVVLVVIIAAIYFVDRFVQSRRLRHRLCKNDPAPTLHIADTGAPTEQLTKE